MGAEDLLGPDDGPQLGSFDPEGEELGDTLGAAESLASAEGR